MVYMQNNGTLVYGVYNGTRVTLVTPKAYNDGAWHQVTSTLSSTGMQFYVDGQLVATNANTVGQNFTGYWRVGGDTTWGSASNYLAGSIDDVAVYTRALTAQQVARHYSLGTTGQPGNAPPTAAFTSSISGLTAGFDASASTTPTPTAASRATAGTSATAPPRPAPTRATPTPPPAPTRSR